MSGHDLTGRTVLLTGASRGIGFETARQLGAAGGQHQAGRLANATPPAWVLINVPMTALSSSAIRSARRKAAERPGAAALVAGLRP